MFIGYRRKSGLEIYRLTSRKGLGSFAKPGSLEGKISMFASGTVDTLAPVKSFGKLVLVVGRDLLLHTRKKFPPASAADLKKAVGLQIGEMFPLKNPSFFLSVFERAEAYTLVDIWAWDSSDYDDLKAVFPFTHVLPEDMAFVSDEPEISVLSGADGSHLVAHSQRGFLGMASFRGSVGRGHIEKLLKAVGRYSGDLKRVNLYAEAGAAADIEDAGLPVVRKESRGHPACLENLSRLDLKQFSVRTGPAALQYVDIGMRSIIYLLVAYSLSLAVAGMHYDAAGNEIKARTAKLAMNMSNIISDQNRGYAEAGDEMKEKLRNWRSPLQVMDLLVKNLPDNSYLTRMVLNETTLELTVASNAPLEVVKALGKAEGVGTVKLKGSIVKNDKGLNTFYLVVDLK